MFPAITFIRTRFLPPWTLLVVVVVVVLSTIVFALVVQRLVTLSSLALPSSAPASVASPLPASRPSDRFHQLVPRADLRGKLRGFGDARGGHFGALSSAPSFLSSGRRRPSSSVGAAARDDVVALAGRCGQFELLRVLDDHSGLGPLLQGFAHLVRDEVPSSDGALVGAQTSADDSVEGRTLGVL